MQFCDHCGEVHSIEELNPVESLKRDVFSANAGESAVLCERCYKEVES